MKKVRILFIALITVLFCVSIASCSEEYSSPLRGKTVENQIIKSDQISKTVTIGTDDLSGFSVSCSANWCSAVIQGSSVVITVQPNETYDERQATITLTDPEDATTLSFQVVQSQKDAIIVDETIFEIPEEGGEISIKVQSNVKYSVKIPSDANWLTSISSSTRGLSSSTVVFKASPNKSGDERVATVQLVDMSSGISQDIVIKQSFTPHIEPEKSVYSIDTEGGLIEIPVSANIPVEMQINSNWIKDGGKENKDGYNFVQKLKISPLGNEKARNGTVSFWSKNEKLNGYAKVTIKQESPLYFTDENVALYVGDSYSLKIINNTGQSVSWKSSNTSVATVNSSGLVTAKSLGSTTITATTVDGRYSASIIISVKEAFKITSGNISIIIGETYSLSFTNNTGQTISWSSSNTSVATVNSSGKVTGVSDGTAIITAKTADGKYSDKITVTVGEFDIERYISGSTDGGYQMVAGPTGTFAGYFVSCTLKNGSTKDINVNKCTVYENGNNIGSETGFGTLKPGGSKYVEVTNRFIDITSRSYKFVWEYSYNGKTYTYTVKYR